MGYLRLHVASLPLKGLWPNTESRSKWKIPTNPAGLYSQPYARTGMAASSPRLQAPIDMHIAAKGHQSSIQRSRDYRYSDPQLNIADKRHPAQSHNKRGGKVCNDLLNDPLLASATMGENSAQAHFLYLGLQMTGI